MTSRNNASSGRIAVISALVFMLASALPFSASGQGTIAYFQPAEPIAVVNGPGIFPPSFYDLDVNGDGIVDYRFNRADGFGVSVEPLRNNRQIALPATPPDLGSSLDPLPAGFQIGSSLSPGYYWVDLSSPNFAGHSTISYCLDVDGSYVCGGLFSGQNAYMGIEFLIGGQPHYGWVHINNPAGTAGGHILEWAYETQPGVSIFASAVPEPSTLALLAIGVGLVALRQRR